MYQRTSTICFYFLYYCILVVDDKAKKNVYKNDSGIF